MISEDRFLKENSVIKLKRSPKVMDIMKKSLTVVVIFLFLGFVVAPSINLIVVKASIGRIQYSDVSSLDSVIWDNYGYSSSSSGMASQLDVVYPFNCQVADDFIMETDNRVTGVHWWGCFFGGDPPWPNPTDFNIIFYADDGTGTMPTGAGMEDPTSTALAVYFIPQVNGIFCGPYDDWFEYNITLPEQFNITANTKYWIAIQAKLPIPPQWGWLTNGDDNPDQLHLPVAGFPEVYLPYWTELDPWYGGDMAFYLIGNPYTPPPTPKPDLDCNGQLSWNDIKPGVTISGSFQIMNIGGPDSHLNWTTVSYPDWGTWTFTPSSGVNLKPDDGAVTVNVDVTAPDIKNEEFEGQVKVVNTDNSSDFCIIPVTLTTPQNHDMFYYPFFARLFELFPYAFPILRQILDNKL
jgi:hypothetical protein